MNTKKQYEIRISLIQMLLSLCALIGFFFFAFTLGAFMGSRFIQGFSAPLGLPPRQSMITDPPVADYGSFETLNQPAGDAGKTASNLSFFEILPQKVEMPPPPMKEASKAGTAAPAEPAADQLPADRPAGTPLKEGAYTIQVAAFLQVAKARALADTLISHGYPAQVVSKTDHNGATWHRVRVGSFKTPEEAQRLLPQLSQLASQPRIIPVQ
jgi:septal ring-binding cell division protein DamX